MQRGQKTTPVLLADAGVETANARVDEFITTGVLRGVNLRAGARRNRAAVDRLDDPPSLYVIQALPDA